MKRTVAVVLCGLLLVQLLPLSVQALDYDPRRIGTKYVQATLPDTNEDVPWVDKIEDPVPPIVVTSESSSAAKTSDSVAEPSTANDFWTNFRLWIGLLSTPHNAKKTEARANVDFHRRTATDHRR